MKSRRLALLNRNDPVANGGGFTLFVGGKSEILRFASPIAGVILANNGNNSSDDNSDPNGPYAAHFSPSMAIIVVVLVAAFIAMGFFSVCLRRCAGEEPSLRASRRGARGTTAHARLPEEGTRGLDRAVIESFPVFSYDLVKGLKAQTKESLECAVCLCEFEDDEQLRLLPKCSHAFHPECIDMWLLSHTTCPVCRTSLAPADDANPTGTNYGVIEAPETIAPVHEVAVVVDGARRNRSVRMCNDVDTPVAHRSAASQESAFGSLGLDQDNKFRRSYSTGHSLVRLRKESDQLATEWYICTAQGLKPGQYRNCTLPPLSHSHSKDPSSSGTRPGLLKQASMSSATSCNPATVGAGRRWYERGLRSDRTTMSSVHPSSFLRSFSEQRAPDYSRNHSQRDRKAYLQPLKNTFKKLTGRDRECTDNSQSGRGTSRVAEESGSSSTA